MNGREIENLLSAMDEGILAGRLSVRGEILRYLAAHEETALEALRRSGTVEVPTSSGLVELKLAQLEALVA